MEKGWEEGLGLDLDLRLGGVLDGFWGMLLKNCLIFVIVVFGKGWKCFLGLSVDVVCFFILFFEMVVGGIVFRSLVVL